MMKENLSYIPIWRRIASLLTLATIVASFTLVAVHADTPECENDSHHQHSSTDHCWVCLFATTLFTPSIPQVIVSVEPQVVERIQYDHSIPTKPFSTSPSDLRAPPITT